MPSNLILKHTARARSRTTRSPRWTTWAPRTGGAYGLPESRQRAARGERRVRRWLQATHAGAHLGALWRPGRGPLTTDGPHPETSDLVAGWWMIDVESYERASSSRPTSPPSPARRVGRCTSGSTSGRSCPGRPRGLTRPDRRADPTGGRGRAARSRPAGSRGLVRRGETSTPRGRAAGGAAGGAAGVARAPARATRALARDGWRPGGSSTSGAARPARHRRRR